MKKNTLGIFGLFILIFVITAVMNPEFLNAYNMHNLIKWSSLYAVMSIGVAFVIITGGIDLSIGSVVGLVAVVLAFMLKVKGLNPAVAIATTLGLSVLIGLIHGLLVTKVKLQPFVVTLCGLLIYRSLARWIGGDHSGLGPIPTKEDAGYANLDSINQLDSVLSGKLALTESFSLPTPLIFMLVIGITAALILSRTIWGRYLFALGNNEDSARYSGINTDALKIAAYVICSLLAGIAGVLFAFEVGAVQPASFGEFYELFAIAGAVLGGCSLRGGEGSMIGIIIAVAIIWLIFNAMPMLGISSKLEYGVLGLVILFGVIADELLKAYAAKRAAAKQQQ